MHTQQMAFGSCLEIGRVHDHGHGLSNGKWPVGLCSGSGFGILAVLTCSPLSGLAHILLSPPPLPWRSFLGGVLGIALFSDLALVVTPFFPEQGHSWCVLPRYSPRPKLHPGLA